MKWPVFKSGLYCVEEESFNTYPTGCRFLQTGESTKRIYPQLVYDMITTHASGSRVSTYVFATDMKRNDNGLAAL